MRKIVRTIISSNLKALLLILFLLLFYSTNAQILDSTSSVKNTLNEVIISANRVEEKLKDIPKQIDIIKAKEIGFMNQQNTADLLTQTGNVFVQKSQAGAGSPVIRGFEANKILLVVDGIRMNNAIYRAGHLQNILRIDQNSLDKIEIVFGPGSVMYGSDALGGVMSFNTKNPILKSKLSGGSHYRYSTSNNENTVHLDLQKGLTNWAFLSSFSFSTFDDLMQGKNRGSEIDRLGLRKYVQGRINNKDTMLINSDPLQQNLSGYLQYDFMQKILFQKNKNVKHKINLHYSNTNEVPRYDRLSEINSSGKFNSAVWYYGPELRTLAAYHLELSSRHTMYDKAHLTFAYQYIEESRHNRNWLSDKLNHRNEYVHVSSVNADFYKQVMKNEIRYGVEYNYNFVKSSAYSEDIATSNRSNLSSRYPDGGTNMNTFASYISHSIEISPKLIISDGLRFSFVSLESKVIDKTFFDFLGQNTFSQNNSALNGTLGITYLPMESWKIWSTIATGFRAPNLDDMGKTFESKSGQTGKAILPNMNLKPEKTINYEIGLNKMFFEKLRIETVGYFTQMTDAITVNKSTLKGLDSVMYDGIKVAAYSNQNGREAYLYGYSLGLKLDITGHIRLSGNLNYTYGRIKTDSSDYPLDHIPPAFGKLSILYHKQKLQFEFFSLFNGDKSIKDYNLQGEDNQQYATANGTPAWFTLNVRSGYELGDNKIQIQAGIDNILDRNYRYFASGISASGRNFWICVKYKY